MNIYSFIDNMQIEMHLNEIKFKKNIKNTLKLHIYTHA